MYDISSASHADLDKLPLVLLVGPGLRQVRASSMPVRRALRSVADANMDAFQIRPSRNSRGTGMAAKFLRLLLAQMMLNAVTHPFDGRRSVQAVRAELEYPDLQLEGEPTFWDAMRAEALRRRGRLALQQARVNRLNEGERLISLKLLTSMVVQFQRAVILQMDLLALPVVCDPPASPVGQARPPSATPAADPGHTLTRTPVPWRATDPPLVMGTNGAWFGRDSMHPSQLVNIQILGGTGSGKTASCVEPPLGALLNYEVDGFKTAMLVIDPKRELEAKVRRVLAERGELDRLVVIGQCPPIRFFEPDCPLSPTDRLVKCEAFGPLITPNGDGSYWHHLGRALLRDLLQLQADFALKSKGGRLFELMADQMGAVRCTQGGSWAQMREILSAARRGGMAKLKEASEVLEQLVRIASLDGAAVNVFKNYTKDDELFRQFTYACQNTDPLVSALSNPDISHFVDMDPLPDNGHAFTNIHELVDAGKVILYCPEARDSHRLAGKVLKAKFFQAVFARENLSRPVAYVCDEYQRFVTQDTESGEQNFLDRCRAYRAICVLASQSLASIEHELGSDNAACTALDIISANTPTKFVMRTTDTRTIDWLRTILPSPETEGPHVVDVRRPSQLRVGEAYSIFADGGWAVHRARLADLT